MPVSKENIVDGLVTAIMYIVEINEKPEVVLFNDHDEAAKALDYTDKLGNNIVVCDYRECHFYIDDLDLFENAYDWRTLLEVRKIKRMKKRA